MSAVLNRRRDVLVSYHYPLFDARSLTNAAEMVPRQASWPKPISVVERLFGDVTPDHGAPFQHYMGPIKLRRAGGVPGWIGENCQCDVTSVRIAGSNRVGDGFDPISPSIRAIFQRFFFDGTCVGKLDIGFHVDPQASISFYRRFVPEAFKSISALAVSCKHLKEKALTFNDLPNVLFSLYSKKPDGDDAKSDVIKVGAPLRLVVIRSGELSHHTEKAFMAAFVDKRRSRFRWSLFDGGAVAFSHDVDGMATFFIFPSDKDNAEYHMRQCRIAFSRIYSEVFCFYGLATALNSGVLGEADDETKNRLLARLNATMVRLTGRERLASKTDYTFYSFVLSSFFEAFSPGVLDEIVGEVRRHGGRHNLLRSIERLEDLPGGIGDGVAPGVVIGEVTMVKQVGIEVSGDNNSFEGAEINIEQVLKSASGEKVVAEIDKLIEAAKEDSPEDAEVLEEVKKKAAANDESWQEAIKRVSLQTLSKASALGLPILMAVMKKQFGL